MAEIVESVLILGIRDAAGHVTVIGSDDLTELAHQMVAQTIPVGTYGMTERYIPDGPPRHTIEASWHGGATIHDTDWGEAFRRLFQDWQPHPTRTDQQPPPPALVPPAPELAAVEVGQWAVFCHTCDVVIGRNGVGEFADGDDCPNECGTILDEVRISDCPEANPDDCEDETHHWGLGRHITEPSPT